MAVHIKQVKGADDLVARDNFVKDNLQGKISFKDNKLVLSVPLTVGKTSSGDSYDFSQLTEDDIVTKKYVDETVENLKGEVSEGYDTLREIEFAIKSISAATGAEPISAQSDSQTGTKVGSISIGDNTVNFYIDLSSYVQKSGNGAAFEVAPTAPSISSAFDDNHLVTASFVHEVEKKLIGLAEETMTTLSEISGAVNHDPDYHTAVDSALSNKLGKDDITITPVETNGTLIGTITLNEDTYELKVDLSLLAPLTSPNFTGSPTVPDVAKNDASSLAANTRFVSTAVSDAVTSIKGSPPDNLNTLEKISNAIGNDTALADNINSSISAIDSMISALNVSISSATGSSSSTNDDKQPLSEALTSISSLPTAADRMIYTTAKDKYAVTTLTSSARDLISKADGAGMREYLSVPKADGAGASGSWSITADKAVNDKDGNPIDTTYLKVDDVVNVTVTNTVTGTDVTRLGTITIGDKSHDINVDLSSYAPLSNATLTGEPTAPTPALTDSSTKIANTGFVQSVVSGAISDLVGEGTPEALNTLKEISEVIGDNSDFTGAIITELGNKVTKVTGKELSSNDFTDALKDKLDKIADNANNYSLPDATTSTKGGVIIGDGLTVSNGKVSVAAATTGKIGGIKLGNGVTTTASGVVSIQSATASQNGLMTSEQASKLASIVAGSEANAINIVKVNGVSLTPDSTKAVNIEIPDIPDINGKVDKEPDKGLSSNDYTTAEKDKLESIASGATKNDVSLIAGTANATTNTSASDPYINLTDNNVKKGFVQIKGGDNVTVSSNASGVITIQSSDTTYDVVSKLSNGLVPSLPNDKTQFLRSDGSWATLAGSDTTYEAGKGISLDSNSNAFSVKVPANSGLSVTDNGISLTAAQTNVIGGVKVATITSSNVSLQTDGSISVPLASSLQAGVIKLSGKTDEYLKSDGSWGKPAGTAYSDATSIQSGLLSSADKKKLDSVTSSAFTGVSVDNTNVTFTKGDGTTVTIQTANTTYGTVTNVTSGLVPTLTNNSTQYLCADGSWATPPDTNTTYSGSNGINVSDTVISADSNYIGSVEKDTTSASSGKFLKADGTWAVPPNDNTTYSSGTGISVSSDNKIHLATAKTGTIGGVKVAAVTTSNISLASNGGISVPLATTSQAGAVKIGTNLTVNNGTVSLSSTNVTDALGFTPADNASIPAAASVMTGASASAAGKAGLVPVPAKGKQDAFLKGDGTWATVVSNDTTYTAGTGISLSGTTFSAHSNYLGSIAKGTDTTKFLNNKGDWAVPPDTNTTYSAGNGLTVSSNSFSVKVPSNSGLSVTTNGVSVTAATGSAIGGVKIGTGISTGAGGVISIPSATTAVNGLMTKAQVSSLAAVADATKNSVSLTAGASKGTVNAAVTSNPYINITDNNSNKGSIQLKGDGAVTISSNAAGIISVTSANDKVAQNDASTEDKTYPVLLSSTANATGNVAASNVNFGSGIKINPKYSAITVGDSITIDGSEGTIQLGSRVLLDSNTANVFTGTCSLESSLNADSKEYYTGEVYVTVSNPKFAIQKGSTITFKMPSLNTNILANSQLDTKLHFNFGTKSNSSIKTGSVAYNAASVKDNSTYTLHLRDIPKDEYYVSVTNNESGYLLSTNTFVQPIRLGGTGATTVAEAKTNLGIKQKTAARFIILYNAASETPNVFELTNNDLTVESGTVICVRFSGFNDFTNHNNIILNVNGSGNSYIAYSYTTYLTVAQVQNGKYYYLYRSGDTWLIDDGANNMLNGWHIGRLYFPNTGKKGLDGIKMLDQFSTVAGGNFLVSAGQRLFLSAGEMFNDIYNNSSVSSSIDGSASGESVWLVSDDEVKIWTGVTENSYNEFTMTKQGVFTAPKITTELLSGPAVHSTTVKGDLGWANKATDGLQVITKNSLAYWDGRYNSISSNLAYCNLGAFGTAATTAASIYPSLAGTNSFSGTNTFTGRTYVKERLIMSTGLAMSSVSTNKWNTAVDNYGQSYTPAGGVAWYHAENSATGVFGITNGSIGSSADNLLLTSGGSLILSAGEAPALNLLRAYGTPNSMYQSINGNGQMHLMSQYDIEFVTNAGNSLNPSNIKRFVFYRNGNATIPGALTLNTPLSIGNGGTGATTAAAARDNLGFTTQKTNSFFSLSYASLTDDSVYNLTDDSLTVKVGTVLGLRFANFASSNNTNKFYLNVNGTGAKPINLKYSNIAPVNSFQNGSYYYFLYTGSAWITPSVNKNNVVFDEPLPITNGGTGATTPAEALNNLGVSTVAADVALQAMGLGNGTGCYTCNISLSGATLVNNSASPMTGFTLKDGVSVYFYVSSASTVTTAAALSFNGTTACSAFLVSGATAAKASVKSFAAGYYRAVYHTSAIGSGTANTWLVFKET